MYIFFLPYREREKEIGGEEEKERVQDNLEFDIMQRKMVCAR